MKNHPNYRSYTVLINENDLHKSASITTSEFGQLVNKFYFFTDYDDGKITAVLIYGTQLYEHYKTIKQSELVFGLKVSEIESVTFNTQSPFVDI